jgi:hypothetical protein
MKIKHKNKLDKIEVRVNSLNQDLFHHFMDKHLLFDEKWFSDMNDYISSLSLPQKMTIVAFTNQSHNHVHRILLQKDLDPFLKKVRAWKRNEKFFGYNILFFPLLQIFNISPTNDLDIKYSCVLSMLENLSDAIIIQALQLLIQSMDTIIEQSPKTHKNFYVYRGIKENKFIDDEKKDFKNQGYTSCSLNPFHALKYMSQGNCCFQKILIPKHSKLLFVGGLSVYKKELECILPRNVNFQIINMLNKVVPITPTKYKNKYCISKTKNITIYDMKISI